MQRIDHSFTHGSRRVRVDISIPRNMEAIIDKRFLKKHKVVGSDDLSSSSLNSAITQDLAVSRQTVQRKTIIDRIKRFNAVGSAILITHNYRCTMTYFVIV